jgi:hypothetical protein
MESGAVLEELLARSYAAHQIAAEVGSPEALSDLLLACAQEVLAGRDKVGFPA